MNRNLLLNLSLLAVTLAALALAAYGFSRTGEHHRISEPACFADIGKTGQPDLARGGHSRRNANSARATPAAKGAPDSLSVGTEPENNDPSSLTSPRTVKADPADSGNAFISGVVVDLTGKGIAGANVRVRYSDFSAPYPQFDPDDLAHAAQWVAYAAAFERQTRDTTTDREGRFQFMGLDETKSYRVWASTPDTTSGVLERVAAGDSSVRIVLAAGQILRGVVTDETGKPVRDFQVTISGRAAAWFSTRRKFSSPDGRFSLPVSGGAITVAASADGFAPSEAREILTDRGNGIVEVTLVLRHGATLSGVVTDQTGAPLAGVAIQINRRGDFSWDGIDSSRFMFSGESDTNESSSSILLDSDGPWSFRSDIFGGEYEWISTDSRGRYKLKGLVPDEYTVTATYGAATKTETVQVKPGITTRDFQLDAGVRVEIRVVNPDGQPADPSSVSLRTERNDFTAAHVFPRREPGLVELSGFAAGTYIVHITCDGYPHVARKESFKSGEINKLSIILQKPAFLSGLIIGAAKTPIGTTCMAWLIKEGETTTVHQGRHSSIDATGNYLLGPVEAGEWMFSVYDNGALRHTTRLELKHGDNFRDLVLDTRGILRVRLQHEDGKPCAWASVSISAVDAAGSTRYVNTDNEGLATLSFIEPGEYTVTAQMHGRGPTSMKTFVREGVNELTFVMKATIGYKISSVIKDSQAEQIGLQVGDVIIAYNGHKITGEADLRSRLSEASSDMTVSLAVTRDGATMTFTLKGGPIGINGQDVVP